MDRINQVDDPTPSETIVRSEASPPRLAPSAARPIRAVRLRPSVWAQSTAVDWAAVRRARKSAA